MGITGGIEGEEFVKYPKTTHLFGSKLAKKDKILSERETNDLLKKNNVNFIWESKIDGTNVGISFKNNDLKVQNRGHYLKNGEHLQYEILLAWANTYINRLKNVLGNRYILYGEWCYAVHTIRYKALPHYMHEFDIYDKERKIFLSTPKRKELLKQLIEDGVLVQVPIVYPKENSTNWNEKNGKLTIVEARKLMNTYPSVYGEDKPEGLYLKVEKEDEVVGRYKLVREEFIQKIIDDNVHWKDRPVEVQLLKEGVDIFGAKTE